MNTVMNGTFVVIPIRTSAESMFYPLLMLQVTPGLSVLMCRTTVAANTLVALTIILQPLADTGTGALAVNV